MTRFRSLLGFAGLVLVVLHLYPAEVTAQGIEPPVEVTPEKRAQTGLKFLDVSASPRASALSNTVVAQRNGDSRSLFYNPASMAEMSKNGDVSLSRVKFLVDSQYDFASGAFRPGTGQYGVVGISLVNVGYGEFNRVIRADNQQGYSKIGTYSPTSLAVGVGYARSFTDRFSVGAQAKYVQQSAGTHAVRENEDGYLVSKNYEVSKVAYDFGVLYRTGFKSLTLGIGARNFAPELTYVRESFELPLTFNVGLSADLVDFLPLSSEMHALNTYTSFKRPRDFSEQVKIGTEYVFMNTLALRGGYVRPTDERGLSLGGGVRAEIMDIELTFDYSYTEFGVFDSVNRFGASASF